MNAVDPMPVEPGSWPTPGQWIYQWDTATEERRLAMATQAIEDAQFVYGLRYGSLGHSIHVIAEQHTHSASELRAWVDRLNKAKADG